MRADRWCHPRLWKYGNITHVKDVPCNGIPKRSPLNENIKTIQKMTSQHMTYAEHSSFTSTSFAIYYCCDCYGNDSCHDIGHQSGLLAHGDVCQYSVAQIRHCHNPYLVLALSTTDNHALRLLIQGHRHAYHILDAVGAKNIRAFTVSNVQGNRHK
ncbi:hypothetical protein Naga_100001g22 [Nannochloropsis gaditana]|uniref:Uncharacterized protein n=1 Tax=Nannochloropsis gaditana TaxID=72520 RepID=W7U182_9STRA|nr:hypothetical protein Naga_100001g22 [Nannochloropsis gaditana]